MNELSEKIIAFELITLKNIRKDSLPFEERSCNVSEPLEYLLRFVNVFTSIEQFSAPSCLLEQYCLGSFFSFGFGRFSRLIEFV